MKPIQIHTPKIQTTLPRHEQEARRARAKVMDLPAIPRKRPRMPAAPPKAEFHTNPLLFGQ